MKNDKSKIKTMRKDKRSIESSFEKNPEIQEKEKIKLPSLLELKEKLNPKKEIVEKNPVLDKPEIVKPEKNVINNIADNQNKRKTDNTELKKKEEEKFNLDLIIKNQDLEKLDLFQKKTIEKIDNLTNFKKKIDNEIFEINRKIKLVESSNFKTNPELAVKLKILTTDKSNIEDGLDKINKIIEIEENNLNKIIYFQNKLNKNSS